MYNTDARSKEQTTVKCKIRLQIYSQNQVNLKAQQQIYLQPGRDRFIEI